MKRAVKFGITIASITLVVSVMIVGIWAATRGSFGLSGATVNWYVDELDIEIYGIVKNYSSDDPPANPKFFETVEEGTTNDIESFKWEIGFLTFTTYAPEGKKVVRPVDIFIAIKNLGDSDVYITFTQPNHIEGLRYEFSAAYGVIDFDENINVNFSDLVGGNGVEIIANASDRAADMDLMDFSNDKYIGPNESYVAKVTMCIDELVSINAERFSFTYTISSVL